MNAVLKRVTFLSALLVPLTALAVSIQPGDFYGDVVPHSPELAGINMLTRAGVLQGYGERKFGPTRLVNRAEFLKIAILSTPQKRQPAAANGVGCFSDVPADAWFAAYVCSAKNAGIVKGNPDGLFHPERTVQYDEALKMLTILYGYEITGGSSGDWGEPYYKAAAARGTDLPIRITFDTPLTRAYSARLAAAFLAESSGQLDELRLAESGWYASSSSSSSSVRSSASSMSSSVSSSSVSSSSSVASSAPASLFTLPSVSHFLLTGQASDAIADGTVRSSGETAKVSLAEVKLFSEVRSIDHLEVVTTDGKIVASLKRKITTDTPDYKLTFQAQSNPEDRFQIPADTAMLLVLRAVVRSDTNAGFSDELLQVRTFSVTTVGDKTNQAVNVPMAGPFPKHQTAFGHILNVKSLSPDTAHMMSGTGVVLGSFSFTGSIISGKAMALSALTFSVNETGPVTLSNITLVNHGSGVSAACTVNAQAMTVSCPVLSGSVGAFSPGSPLILDLKSNVTVQTGAQNATLQASLNASGSPESLGAVEWTDGSGMFRWIEYAHTPVARGTLFK